ncbi:MAG: hypothetical protein J6V98_04000 [Bacteroidales bacterium]|nr:hypothetical protein [Bacteroidales bacterium]
MGLSSNILWHQTDKNGFYEILHSKRLCYSYSRERIILENGLKPVAFPMISVSDYPFSEIGNNQWTYGDFCIGFNQKWGEKTGFSPVCYCSYGSRILQQLNGLLRIATKYGPSNLVDWVMYMFAQMKFVEAPLETKNQLFEKYRFYDEREWRVIPNKPVLDKAGLKPYLTEKDYKDYKEKNNGKSLLEIGVDFQYEDIHYIIVETKEDVHKTRDMVGVEVHIFTKDEVVEDVIGIEHHEEIMPSQMQMDIEAAQRQLERVGNDLIKGRKKIKQE